MCCHTLLFYMKDPECNSYKTSKTCHWDIKNKHCVDKKHCDSFKKPSTCTSNKCYFDVQSSKCMDEEPKHHTTPGHHTTSGH